MPSCTTTSLEIMDAKLIGRRYTDCTTYTTVDDFRTNLKPIDLFKTDSIMMATEVMEGDPIYNSEGTEGSRFAEYLPQIGQRVTLTITTKDINEKVNEMLSLSTKTAVVQTAQTDTTVVIASSEAEIVNYTGYYRLTAFTLKNTATPTTVYALGTDYAVDLMQGTFKILASGTIAGGTGVTATLSAVEITNGAEYSFGDNSTDVDWYLEAHARSTTGAVIQYIFPKVTIKPSGDQTIKGETKEASVITFECEVIKCSGIDPYKKIII